MKIVNLLQETNRNIRTIALTVVHALRDTSCEKKLEKFTEAPLNLKYNKYLLAEINKTYPSLMFTLSLLVQKTYKPYQGTSFMPNYSLMQKAFDNLSSNEAVIFDSVTSVSEPPLVLVENIEAAGAGVPSNDFRTLKILELIAHSLQIDSEVLYEY